MLRVWLSHQMRNLWWWGRGVTHETYRARCARCGCTGQVHLMAGGCLRFVTPVPVPDNEPGRRAP
jgi:hypothetical protein